MPLDLFETLNKVVKDLEPQASTEACGEEGPDLCGGVGSLRDIISPV